MMRDRTTSVREKEPELGPRLDNVLFDVWLVSRATTALLDEVVRPSGLDSDEFAIYSVLASGEGMTPTELAHWMSAPATTVSSYVKRFEGRGHVERTPNPDDGRSYRLRLTASGRRAHRAAGNCSSPYSTARVELIRAASNRRSPSSARPHRAVDTLNEQA